MLRVPTIIGSFMCLEACCHVTTRNANGNCHCSTFATSKLSNERETEYRHIY